MAGEGTTLGSLVKGAYQGYKALPLRTRLTSSAVIGGSVGALASDQKGESMTGTAIDAAKGAGIHMGITYASDWASRTFGDEAKQFFKEYTPGKLAIEEGAQDTERMVRNMKRVAEAHGIAKVGIAALIGVGTILDVSKSFHEKEQVEKENARIEDEQKKKQSHQNQMVSELFGWQKHQNMGQLVLDMWDDRIGHHLMGNNKFQ